VHPGGGEAGVADGSYKFATRIGGGIDVPLSAHFAVRIIQIDYYLTTFANAPTTIKIISWWALASSSTDRAKNSE
jgi:hypothetical protein